MNKELWVFIKDKQEIDRRYVSEYKEADVYEQMMRKYRGLKWCDSWCTMKNAAIIGYNVNINFREFLAIAGEAVNSATKENKIIVFIEWRYRKLALAFPHETFSVSQSSLDFFAQTLLYLESKLPSKYDEKNNKKSIYELNYIEWMEKNKI